MQVTTKTKPTRKLPTLKQRKEWHPPATDKATALSRMKTLIYRLRSRHDQYNADIAEMEVLPFILGHTAP